MEQVKQTAVEWFVYKLNLEPDAWKKDLIEQAKEMEKKQREKDFVNGYKARAKGSNLIFDETSEMYAIKLLVSFFRNES